jgi:hypothetical protein
MLNPTFEAIGEVIMEPLVPPVPLPNVPKWTNPVPWTLLAIILFLVPSALYVIQAAYDLFDAVGYVRESAGVAASASARATRPRTPSCRHAAAGTDRN